MAVVSAPPRWRHCTLGDGITLQRGFDLPERERRAGNAPIVSSSGVTGSHDVSKVAGPGVVTGRYGTLGEVFYVSEDFWPLNTTLYVRDFKGNDPLFISYFLRTLNFGRQNAAGAVPGVNRNHLHLLPVMIPPLPVQRKIAGILSAYDDLIENNSRRIAILEEMAQALYREWFVNFRFPGHEGCRMVESELGLIPGGWRVVRLGEIASYINRGVSPKYDDAAQGLVLNQKCIRDGRVSLGPSRHHVTTVADAKRVRFGDVFINSTGIGTLGRVAQVYQHIPECTVDSHVTIVRPSSDVELDYVGMSLLRMEPYFDSKGTGTTGQTELSRESVAAAKLLVPPEEIQLCFGRMVRPPRQLCAKLGECNVYLRRTRDLLLPKLVSGEVDVGGTETDLDLA